MKENTFGAAGEELLRQLETRDERCSRELYPELARIGGADEETRAALRQQVKEEAGDLKRAAASLRQAGSRASVAADELETRLREGESSGKKRRIFHAPPANSVVDYEERAGNHFARGLNFYKLALIVIVGSFAGVVVESVWCVITNGYLESRAGLVYGPFNLLYGVGAVLLTATLYRFRNRSSLWSFAGGMIVGSALEYVCSWAQELVFGSTSWDYSHMPFNLNGRICLLYSVFWGVLGVLWVKNIYPRFAKVVLKVPNRPGRIATLVLTVFLAFNCVVSLAAVGRWAERRVGDPANTAVERFLDDRFPNERMERVYANMDFGDE